MNIEISCKGAEEVSLDELNDLQGKLKELPEESYAKLRNSITQYGFSFPISYWKDEEGKKWIADGHQRIATLKKMRNEGCYIPLLPADPIYAKDKTEAKKKLLLLNSQYGKLTQEGWDEFTSDIPMDDIADLLELPDMELQEEEPEEEQEKSGNPKPPKEAKCPECGAEFTIEK